MTENLIPDPRSAAEPMSRRGVLRMAGGVMLAAGAVGLDAGVSQAGIGQTGSGVEEFQGIWNGTYDGREATLRTVVDRQGADDFRVSCSLLDHTKSETYVGYALHIRGDARELTDIRLRGQHGSDLLTWRALSLRTWTKDPHSGVRWWTESLRDNPFSGLSFYRGPAATRPAVAWHSGSAKGPNARLKTSVGVFDSASSESDRFLLCLDRSRS